MIMKGALVSASLIAAIGAQNAFVLRQGLAGAHILAVVLVCFICDVLLMALGIFGVGRFIEDRPILSAGVALAGAGFLLWYGARAFLSALHSDGSLQPARDGATSPSLASAVGATLGVTLLNPHVYLDTVVIVGGIAGTLSHTAKLQFLAGALLASFVWFFGLGFGARLLQPVFRSARAWRILDLAISLVMGWIALGLLRHAGAQLG